MRPQHDLKNYENLIPLLFYLDDVRVLELVEQVGFLPKLDSLSRQVCLGPLALLVGKHEFDCYVSSIPSSFLDYPERPTSQYVAFGINFDIVLFQERYVICTQ